MRKQFCFKGKAWWLRFGEGKHLVLPRQPLGQGQASDFPGLEVSFQTPEYPYWHLKGDSDAASACFFLLLRQGTGFQVEHYCLLRHFFLSFSVFGFTIFTCNLGQMTDTACFFICKLRIMSTGPLRGLSVKGFLMWSAGHTKAQEKYTLLPRVECKTGGGGVFWAGLTLCTVGGYLLWKGFSYHESSWNGHHPPSSSCWSFFHASCQEGLLQV